MKTSPDDIRRRLMPLLVAAAALSACSETAQDDASSYDTTEQAIYYGTRAPSVTNLSAGEEMAIGFIADSSGSPFCTATLIDRDVAITHCCHLIAHSISNYTFSKNPIHGCKHNKHGGRSAKGRIT